MAIRAPKDARHAENAMGGAEIDLTVDDPTLAAAGLSDAVDIEELWKHRAELHKLCARIVGDPITADDMVQETYLRALRHRDKLENRPSLMPWLATVARRRSLDELRSRTRSTPFEYLPETPAGPDDDPERRVPAAETVAKVKDAFSTLNDRERELLTRQIEEGMSLSELALEENSSVDAVRSVLVRARAKLRHAIGDDAIFPAAAPIGGLGLWLRQKFNGFGLRVQRAFATTPLEAVGQAVTAGIVGLAIGVAPAAIPAVGGATASETDAPASAATSDAGTNAAALSEAGAPEVLSSGAHRRATSPTDGTRGAVITGAAVLPLLNPPDDVETPEDARFDSFAVAGSGTDAVVLAAGTRRDGCVSGCTVLFRSTDGGASWSRLPATGITGTSVVAAPGYPADSRLFALGDRGLSVSRDGGETFQTILAVAPGPLAISPAFSAGDQRVFVGTGPALVWDDATRSVSPLVGLTVSHKSFFSFEPGYPGAGTLFVGGAAPGGSDFQAAVYRCTHTLGEDSCVDHTALPGAATTPKVAAVPLAGAGRAVFAWSGTSFFRSLDGGVSFGTISLPADLQVNGVAGDARGGLFAATHATYAGTAGGILRSVDGGASWHSTGAGTPLADGATAVTALPSGRVVAAPLAFAGGGVMCSSDGGNTWEARCS